MSEKVYIPVLSVERVAELFKHIKPVYEFDGVKRYIKPVALHTVAYTWDAKPAAEAVGLIPLTDITTYHKWGYYGFFKPSIGEVLRQIPEDLLEQVVAFEIVDSPKNSEDLNKNLTELNDGYHVATTRLYRK